MKEKKIRILIQAKRKQQNQNQLEQKISMKNKQLCRSEKKHYRQQRFGAMAGDVVN
jgi:hypothetical protein